MTDSAPISSPWQLKPWWCQPWSIVLTGCAIVGGSWLLLHRLWLTGLVAVPIGLWMGFFVLVWPRCPLVEGNQFYGQLGKPTG